MDGLAAQLPNRDGTHPDPYGLGDRVYDMISGLKPLSQLATQRGT